MPESDPATNLTSIMPRWLVVQIAVLNLFLTFFVLFGSLLWQNTIFSPIGRGLVILCVSISLGIFSFVLYPHPTDTKVDFKLGLRFVGPLAVTVALFLFLNRMMPHPVEWKPFLFESIIYDGVEYKLVSSTTIESTERGVEWCRILDSNNDLLGFAIRYNPNETSKTFKLKFSGDDRDKRVPVSAHRNSEYLEISSSLN
ncbi:hypothetical protein SH580_06945 [Coraliomargarita algicola]|uniref:Uncharacterized protein n=1 Tax=Coraliomargarita algicola TaxID=3092156 RepID=A0ABZ0RQR1_9BACT|nr:hypothetical protein [Coraliomargarita sp. J2-16]WPJ97446.1 hypothetical protein SH580_06945 [Coraliomargarita sp. J2-16]